MSSAIMSSQQQQNQKVVSQVVIPPKPSRPFTRYNVYFQLEREYILQADGQGSAATAPKSVDQNAAARPERYRDLVLPQDWYVVGKCRDKKRKHRKTHGTITFVQLTKAISKSWGEVDDATKQYCSDLADVELKRYRKDMADFIAKYGESAAKGSNGKRKAASIDRQQQQQECGPSQPAMSKGPLHQQTETSMTPLEMERMQMRLLMLRQRTQMQMHATSPIPSSCASMMNDEADFMMNRAAAMRQMNDRIESMHYARPSFTSSYSSPFYSGGDSPRPMKRSRLVSPQGSFTDFEQFQESSYRHEPEQHDNIQSMHSTSPQQDDFDDEHDDLFYGDIHPIADGSSLALNAFDDDDDEDCDMIWNALADGGNPKDDVEVKKEEDSGGYVMNNAEAVCSDISQEYLEQFHSECKRSMVKAMR